MKMMKWVLPIGGIAALFGIVHLMHSGHSAGAMPPAMRSKVAAALAGANPVAMHALATEIRHKGYTEQADSLDKAADEIEKAIKATPAAAVPRAPLPKGNSQDSAGPERRLAGRVALAFSTTPPGEGAAGLLRTYQTQEKARDFYRGNIDGLYGPKSALSLALDHAIVPPRPLFWPKGTEQKAKKNYVDTLERLAASDPQRAEEWRHAAKGIL